MQYHGTSLKNALAICNNQNKTNVAYFHTFDSQWSEGFSGALAFATADGKRHGSVKNLEYLNLYAEKNENFPIGIKGFIIKAMLKQIAHKEWEKNHSFVEEFEKEPCVIVTHDHPNQKTLSRPLGIREVYLNLQSNRPDIVGVYVSKSYEQFFKDLDIRTYSLEDAIEGEIKASRKVKFKK